MTSLDDLLRQTAARGKYAPLFRHLCALGDASLRITFGQVEAILGFRLPNSARVHRPWWSNQRQGGHSHALAWQAAGWRTSAVDLAGEELVFERLQALPLAKEDDDAPPSADLEAVFPPHDFGAWPQGFSARRDEIYGDEGR